MNKLNLTDEDKTKFVNFLNMVASHAQFNFNTKEVIEYFKLLNYMQTQLLPKIEANILEVKKVVKPKESTTKES